MAIVTAYEAPISACNTVLYQQMHAALSSSRVRPGLPLPSSGSLPITFAARAIASSSRESRQQAAFLRFLVRLSCARSVQLRSAADVRITKRQQLCGPAAKAGSSLKQPHRR